MNSKLLCEYCFKFYLNASHSIIINGKQGEVHPHTWEIMLDIVVERKDFMEFNEYEKVAGDFFSKYQEQVLNDVEPFDTIMPTLENIVDYFGGELRQCMRQVGGTLVRIEGSETPTRSYAVSYEGQDEYVTDMREHAQESLSRVIEDMLEQMLNGEE